MISFCVLHSPYKHLQPLKCIDLWRFGLLLISSYHSVYLILQLFSFELSIVFSRLFHVHIDRSSSFFLLSE